MLSYSFLTMIDIANRQRAATVRSRSSAVLNLNSSFEYEFRKTMRPNEPENFNADKFLIRSSWKSRFNPYSIDELKELGNIYSLKIQRLKRRIKKSFLYNQNWRTLLQKKNHPATMGLLTEQIWRSKKRNLLLNIYCFIFIEKIDYAVTYLAVLELFSENHLNDEFGKYATDPLTLAISSAMEYANFCEQSSADFSSCYLKN